jgi:hypothetical protein
MNNTEPREVLTLRSDQKGIRLHCMCVIWQSNVDSMISDVVDGYKDGISYSRDPHTYYGVSSKDLMEDDINASP